MANGRKEKANKAVLHGRPAQHALALPLQLFPQLNWSFLRVLWAGVSAEGSGWPGAGRAVGMRGSPLGGLGKPLWGRGWVPPSPPQSLAAVWNLPTRKAGGAVSSGVTAGQAGLLREVALGSAVPSHGLSGFLLPWRSPKPPLFRLPR